MNSTILDIIKKRRSVRKYKDHVPSKEKIRLLIESARWAPSGLNNQPWRFMVVEDNKKKNKIASFTKYSHIIESAPLIIMVFLDIKESYNRDKDLMAIGSSIQNILLEAYSLGLSTCWLGEILNKKHEISEYLGLSSDLELTAVVSLGYSDEAVKVSKRKPLEDILL